MNTTLIIDNLERIITECHGLGADKCPPAPHACPKCEILHLAEEALKAARECNPPCKLQCEVAAATVSVLAASGELNEENTLAQDVAALVASRNRCLRIAMEALAERDSVADRFKSYLDNDAKVNNELDQQFREEEADAEMLKESRQ